MDRKQTKTYSDAVEFHGHSCPGLALGYRVAVKALEWLDANRSEDEEVVALVENDSCAVDAIQVVTGCTFGKGNLIFRDIGKRGYTFYNRNTGKSIRIVDNYTLAGSPRIQELKKAVFQGTATEKEKEEWQAFFRDSIDEILKTPEHEILRITDVRSAPPPRARILDSLTCRRCGEQVMESRAVITDAGVFCADCEESRDK
jgi:formylmethanofuran dehydrogenase subunit E